MGAAKLIGYTTTEMMDEYKFVQSTNLECKCNCEQCKNCTHKNKMDPNPVNFGKKSIRRKKKNMKKIKKLENPFDI